MKSFRKFIVEMEGRAVFATKSYDVARRVAWRLIHKNKDCEIIVHLYGIIVGI
jgi:hypothetical protein